MNFPHRFMRILPPSRIPRRSLDSCSRAAGKDCRNNCGEKTNNTSRIKRRVRSEGGAPMTTWTRDELNKIGTVEELEIAPLRHGGTAGKPVTISTVCVGDDVYVRSAYGPTSAWFRGAQLS